MVVTAKEERVFPLFKNITTIIFIMGLDPQISPSKPMHLEGGSLLDSLVGAHAHVLDISCQFLFCNDLHHHISSILVSVDLSYLEQMFFNSLPDPMISHIYVIRPYMIRSVLASLSY